MQRPLFSLLGINLGGLVVGGLSGLGPLAVLSALLLAILIAAPAAAAQVDAVLPAASAPGADKAGRRLLTPEETRENAAQSGDLRPERPAEPLISVPIGKRTPAGAKPKFRAVSRTDAVPSGVIDDSAARCEAEQNAALRATCLAKLERESKAGSVH